MNTTDASLSAAMDTLEQRKNAICTEDTEVDTNTFMRLAVGLDLNFTEAVVQASRVGRIVGRAIERGNHPVQAVAGTWLDGIFTGLILSDLRAGRSAPPKPEAATADADLRTDFIDFPTGWALQRIIGHNALNHLSGECSAVQSAGAVLCDCGAIAVEWKRRGAEGDWLRYIPTEQLSAALVAVTINNAAAAAEIVSALEWALYWIQRHAIVPTADSEEEPDESERWHQARTLLKRHSPDHGSRPDA